MDREFIKELLLTEDGRSDKLIKNGDFIDEELLNLLKNAERKNLQKVFYIYKGSAPHKGYKYSVELRCPLCGSLCKKDVSKTNLMYILGCLNSYSCDKYIAYCDKCKKEKIEKEKEEKRKQKELYEEEKKIETKYYIENYLNPNNSFKKSVSAKEKVNSIMGLFLIDDLVMEKVSKMEYLDFLKTPYWDGIRTYKLRNAKYRCELCGCQGILNVHHKTYSNHGLEHVKSVANKDLIVLCQNCHEKFHEKLGDMEASS